MESKFCAHSGVGFSELAKNKQNEKVPNSHSRIFVVEKYGDLAGVCFGKLVNGVDQISKVARCWGTILNG